MIKKNGFTLIELMIVVAIIGILASIAIPQFSKFRIKAFNAAAHTDVKNGHTAIEASYQANFEYPARPATVSTTSIVLGSEVWVTVSKGVTIGHQGTTSSYVLAAKHFAGDKIYKATNDTSEINEYPSSENYALTTGDL